MEKYTLTSEEFNSSTPPRFTLKFGKKYQFVITDATNCVEVWLFDEQRKHMPVGTTYTITYGDEIKNGTLTQAGLLREYFKKASADGLCTVEWAPPDAGVSSVNLLTRGGDSRPAQGGAATPDRAGTYATTDDLLVAADEYLHNKLSELMMAHAGEIRFHHPLVYSTLHPKPGTVPAPAAPAVDPVPADPGKSAASTGNGSDGTKLFSKQIQLVDPANSDLGDDSTAHRLACLGYESGLDSLTQFKTDEGHPEWSDSEATQFLSDCWRKGLERSV